METTDTPTRPKPFIPIALRSFQDRVWHWVEACFGPDIAKNRLERNHRFLEESLELVQACGCTAHEAHQLVDYVFGRPIGEQYQEVGGVMVTLAALCTANDLDMQGYGEEELSRVWEKISQIREKQAAKPKNSPLPGHARRPAAGVLEQVREIISDQLAIALDEVKSESQWRQDLGADSLDDIELIMAFEEAFSIEIPEEESRQFRTVADVVAFIESRQAA